MERNDYIMLAQKYSIDKKTVVYFDSIRYYPIGYKMDFDHGTPVNKALLLDKNNNATIEVLISKVVENL